MTVECRVTEIDGNSYIKFRGREIGNFLSIQKYFFEQASLKYYFKKYMLLLGYAFVPHYRNTKMNKTFTCPQRAHNPGPHV